MSKEGDAGVAGGGVCCKAGIEGTEGTVGMKERVTHLCNFLNHYT